MAPCRRVPTGYRGYQKSTRGIRGHELGLKLTTKDRSDLIAFLKTL